MKNDLSISSQPQYKCYQLTNLSKLRLIFISMIYIAMISLGIVIVHIVFGQDGFINYSFTATSCSTYVINKYNTMFKYIIKIANVALILDFVMAIVLAVNIVCYRRRVLACCCINEQNIQVTPKQQILQPIQSPAPIPTKQIKQPLLQQQLVVATPSVLLPLLSFLAFPYLLPILYKLLVLLLIIPFSYHFSLWRDLGSCNSYYINYWILLGVILAEAFAIVLAIVDLWLVMQGYQRWRNEGDNWKNQDVLPEVSPQLDQTAKQLIRQQLPKQTKVEVEMTPLKPTPQVTKPEPVVTKQIIYIQTQKPQPIITPPKQKDPRLTFTSYVYSIQQISIGNTINHNVYGGKDKTQRNISPLSIIKKLKTKDKKNQSFLSVQQQLNGDQHNKSTNKNSKRVNRNDQRMETSRSRDFQQSFDSIDRQYQAKSPVNNQYQPKSPKQYQPRSSMNKQYHPTQYIGSQQQRQAYINKQQQRLKNTQHQPKLLKSNQKFLELQQDNIYDTNKIQVTSNNKTRNLLTQYNLNQNRINNKNQINYQYQDRFQTNHHNKQFDNQQQLNSQEQQFIGQSQEYHRRLKGQNDQFKINRKNEKVHNQVIKDKTVKDRTNQQNLAQTRMDSSNIIRSKIPQTQIHNIQGQDYIIQSQENIAQVHNNITQGHDYIAQGQSSTFKGKNHIVQGKILQSQQIYDPYQNSKQAKTNKKTKFNNNQPEESTKLNGTDKASEFYEVNKANQSNETNQINMVQEYPRSDKRSYQKLYQQIDQGSQKSGSEYYKSVKKQINSQYRIDQNINTNAINNQQHSIISSKIDQNYQRINTFGNAKMIKNQTVFHQKYNQRNNDIKNVTNRLQDSHNVSTSLNNKNQQFDYNSQKQKNNNKPIQQIKSIKSSKNSQRKLYNQEQVDLNDKFMKQTVKYMNQNNYDSVFAPLITENQKFRKQTSNGVKSNSVYDLSNNNTNPNINPNANPNTNPNINPNTIQDSFQNKNKDQINNDSNLIEQKSNSIKLHKNDQKSKFNQKNQIQKNQKSIQPKKKQQNLDKNNKLIALTRQNSEQIIIKSKQTYKQQKYDHQISQDQQINPKQTFTSRNKNIYSSKDKKLMINQMRNAEFKKLAKKKQLSDTYTK